MTNVRLANENDFALIHHSWSRCLRDAQVLKHVPNALYFRGMKREIDRLLERSDTYILCSEEDPGQIFSYAVTERIKDELIIHFAYTKSFYWRMGLMKELLKKIEPEIERNGAVVTFFAPCFSDQRFKRNDGSFWLYLKDKYKLVFNPFLKDLDR